MRGKVDTGFVGVLSALIPGAGLAYLGMWAWAVVVFIAEVSLIGLISRSTGHPVITWLVLALICGTASTGVAQHHNERLSTLPDVPPPPPMSAASMHPVPPPPPPPSLNLVRRDAQQYGQFGI